MKCQQCGSDINDNAKFCKYCGSPVYVSKEESVTDNNLVQCHKCGKQVNGDNLFCTNCGTSLSGKSTENVDGIKEKRKKGLSVFLFISVIIILGCIAFTTFYFFGNDIKMLLGETLVKTDNPELFVEDDLENEEPDTTDKDIASNSEQEITSTEESTEDNIPTVEEPTISIEAISEAKSIDVTSSSALSEYDMIHNASRMMDGDLSTAWVEGVEGHGIGEQITFEFDAEYIVNGFKINAGYQKSSELYKKNSRPEEIYIQFSDGSGVRFMLEDKNEVQDIKFGTGIATEYVKITINSVYEGNKYEDTVISEISFY